MDKANSNTFFAGAVLLFSSLSYAGESPLSLSASIGVEYDDNLSVSALDTTTGQSDEAIVLDFSASYLAIESENTELELVYDLYQSKHDTFSDFDLQIHTLSAFGSWEVDDMDLGLYYSYSMVDLGNEALYDSHSLTPSLGFALAEGWYNRFSYGHVSKDFASASERDAAQNSISADNYYFFMDNSAFVSLGAKLELEDAEDNELDYQAIYLKTAVSFPFYYNNEKLIDLKGRYERYWRDYDNVTLSIGKKRDDNQDLIGLELIKPINESFDVVLDYEYTNTRSNLPSVDAEENVITLRVTTDF
ncbi:hypothetical protein [Amphritea sp. HPY]|uniref:hypothetical protein n=1 Tax=Amphritea sp. HPY TaxID=3421652 RepID=UPI003D7CAB06